MYTSNDSEPIIPPTQSDPNLKEYRCPHCSKFLFKGNVQKLRMVCHHCQVMINTDESRLVGQRKIEFTN
jgi:phage FluMu protein Com